jgi:hypothetical protein
MALMKKAGACPLARLQLVVSFGDSDRPVKNLACAIYPKLVPPPVGCRRARARRKILTLKHEIGVADATIHKNPPILAITNYSAPTERHNRLEI